MKCDFCLKEKDVYTPKNKGSQLEMEVENGCLYSMENICAECLNKFIDNGVKINIIGNKWEEVISV